MTHREGRPQPHIHHVEVREPGMHVELRQRLRPERVYAGHERAVLRIRVSKLPSTKLSPAAGAEFRLSIAGDVVDISTMAGNWEDRSRQTLVT